MLRAVTALRFRIQGAQDPHDDSVAQELTALITEVWSIVHFCRNFRMVKDERFLSAVLMVGFAVKGKETDQLVGVLLDLFRSVRTFDFGFAHKFIFSRKFDLSALIIVKNEFW